MQEINWIQIGIAFAGGSVSSTILKQILDNRKNRIQPITYNIELRSVYDQMADSSLSESYITLTNEKIEYKFPRLWTGSIELFNFSQTDFKEFEFGITGRNLRFLQITPYSLDRHHNATVQSAPTLQSPAEAFDAILKPFNRKESYRFDFLLTSDSMFIKEDSLKVSSPHPVSWIKPGEFKSRFSKLASALTEVMLSRYGLGK